MDHDPVTTAKELSAKLREHDKKTRISDLKPVAVGLLGKLASKANEVGCKLGRFKASMSAGGNAGPSLDSGLDTLSGSYTAFVQATHHNNQKMRIYKIASRLEKCVVLVCDYDNESGKYSPKKEWRQVAQYEGAPENILPDLVEEFQWWLDLNLHELCTEIVGAAETDN